MFSEFSQEISKSFQFLSSSTNTSKTQEEKIQLCINSIGKLLLSSDVEIRLVASIQSSLRKAIKDKLASSKSSSSLSPFTLQKILERQLTEELFRLVEGSSLGKEIQYPKTSHLRKFMFLGLQGSGKTTTCCKLALFYKKLGLRVAVVGLDTFRAGALDQLKQNALKCKIPVFGHAQEVDPVQLWLQLWTEVIQLVHLTNPFDILLIDTAGRHVQSSALMEEMNQLYHTLKPDHCFFVLDSSIGAGPAKQQAQSFASQFPIGSIVLTKWDSSTSSSRKGGGVLAAIQAAHTSVSFVGSGEHMDQLEVFDAEVFVARMMGKPEIKSMLRNLQVVKERSNGGTHSDAKTPGKLTIRYLKEQYEMLQSAQSLGLGGGAGGLMSLFSGGGDVKQMTTQFGRFRHIFNSMSEQELNMEVGKFQMNASRIERIARGAGLHSTQPVKDLLQSFKPMQNYWNMYQKWAPKNQQR